MQKLHATAEPIELDILLPIMLFFNKLHLLCFQNKVMYYSKICLQKLQTIRYNLTNA